MKKATMQDVADKAGVSITTVSRYINKNGYVAQEKQALIEDAMRHLAYTGTVAPAKNPLASRTIGLIVPHADTSFFHDRLSASLVQAADTKGYRTVMAQGEGTVLSGAALQQLLERLCDQRLCGLVIAGIADGAVSEEIRHTISRMALPVVFVERTYGCTGFNRIEIDTRAGMHEAVKYMLAKGHQQLLYLDGHTQTAAAGKRQQGFCEAVEAAGASVQAWISHCDGDCIEDCRQKTAEAFAAHPGITGVLTWSDLIAAGALQYMQAAGITAEVIGYDDILAPFLAPPISSVHMPLREMALAAIQLIDESQENALGGYARTVSIEPKLVLRSAGNTQE